MPGRRAPHFFCWQRIAMSLLASICASMFSSLQVVLLAETTCSCPFYVNFVNAFPFGKDLLRGFRPALTWSLLYSPGSLQHWAALVRGTAKCSVNHLFGKDWKTMGNGFLLGFYSFILSTSTADSTVYLESLGASTGPLLGQRWTSLNNEART